VSIAEKEREIKEERKEGKGGKRRSVVGGVPGLRGSGVYKYRGERKRKRKPFTLLSSYHCHRKKNKGSFFYYL